MNMRVMLETIEGIDRIRTLIVDLAISGKLVTDVQLKNSPTKQGEHVGPYPLPQGWSWQQLPEVTSDLGQLTPANSFTYIDVSGIDNKKGVISHNLEVVLPENAPSRARKRVKVGTVIYSTVRPYLKNIAVVDRIFDPPAIASTAFAILHPTDRLNSRYLYYCLRSTYFTEFVESRQKGVAYPAINARDLAKSLIPLPPLEAQIKIVSAIDDLMLKCDELQLKLEETASIGIAARKSAVDAIVKAQTPSDLGIAWERIKNNWTIIAGDLDSVDSLRKLILSLASKGKLIESSDRFVTAPLTVELKDVCKVSWGNLSLTKKSYVHDGAYLAVSAAGPDGRIDSAEHKAFTPVLSAIGARCGTMFMPDEDFTAIKNTMTFQPKPEIIDSWYLLYVLKGSDLPKRGSAQPFMSKADIEKFRIRVPNLDEQKLIAKVVEALLEKCDLLESNLRGKSEVAKKLSNSITANLA
jgi:restriction endonuclease S subunit